MPIIEAITGVRALRSSGIAIPNIGDNVYDGYYAGLIDTTRSGSIIATDYYQTGSRYLLIMSPQSLDFTNGKRWKTTQDAGPSETKTRWNGLGATVAMKNAGAVYEAATYCYDLSYNTTDGGSRWYLPAMDELELLYRSFKPTTNSNYTFSQNTLAGSFPGNGSAVLSGTNPSSSPSSSQYTAGSPAQTSLALFQSGGAQALNTGTTPIYWASTEYNATAAWGQYTSIYSGQQYSGWQALVSKNSTLRRVRPVRRVVL